MDHPACSVHWIGCRFTVLVFHFLQLQQSSSEETNRHPSAEEESAKVFLEEILTQVCRDADNPPSEQKENFDKTEGTSTKTKIKQLVGPADYRSFTEQLPCM